MSNKSSSNCDSYPTYGSAVCLVKRWQAVSFLCFFALRFKVLLNIFIIRNTLKFKKMQLESQSKMSYSTFSIALRTIMITATSVRNNVHLLIFPVFLTLLVCNTAYTQDKSIEIDKIFSWATPATPGCVCAVSQHGKVVVNRAYGLADLERNVPLTTNSIFDAASLTKQFVAAAILLLVEEKRLALSDDVHKYIPELPDYGHKMTIDHLLNHTSGLRDWTGISLLTAASADALTLVLRQRSLDFAPGEEWSYSNSGYVLLKEIVGRTSGLSFDEFAHKHLFQPLGMKLTTYQNDLRAVVKNRALAYEMENGHWKLDMVLDNDRGGGGALLSTANDLLIWNEALTTSRLGTYVTEKLHEPARLNNGRKLGYARGLFLDVNRGGKVVWHTGGSRGYGSILGRFPEQGLSIAIMCNSGETGNRMAMTRRIFDLFVPSADSNMAEGKTPVTASNNTNGAVSDLNSKAGLFFSERTAEPMRLIMGKDKLNIAGGPALVMVSKDRFRNSSGTLTFMSGDAFELNFLSNDQFELRSMEGNTTRYRRAVPYAPAVADLQAFSGQYESKEIRSIIQIVAAQDKLVLRLEHSPDKSLEFKPVDKDTFQWGRMTIRFHRDKNGKIVALDYSNPVLRKVQFTRLHEDKNYN
jgi:CubicO group peptidase (beta-lactamase class C family)